MITLTRESLSKPSESILLKETAEGTFSANYVIQAYEAGKRKGEDTRMLEIQTDSEKRLSKNLMTTIESINRMLTELISSGVAIRSGWIKSEDIDSFDVILAIPQKDLYADSFLEFYIKANQIETSLNNADFYINFGFINQDKQINEEMLEADGYRFRVTIDYKEKIPA